MQVQDALVTGAVLLFVGFFGCVVIAWISLVLFRLVTFVFAPTTVWSNRNDSSKFRTKYVFMIQSIFGLFL